MVLVALKCILLGFGAGVGLSLGTAAVSAVRAARWRRAAGVVSSGRVPYAPVPSVSPRSGATRADNFRSGQA